MSGSELLNWILVIAIAMYAGFLIGRWSLTAGRGAGVDHDQPDPQPGPLRGPSIDRPGPVVRRAAPPPASASGSQPGSPGGGYATNNPKRTAKPPPPAAAGLMDKGGTAPAKTSGKPPGQRQT